MDCIYSSLLDRKTARNIGVVPPCSITSCCLSRGFRNYVSPERTELLLLFYTKSPSFFLQKTWDSYSMHIIKLSSSGIMIAAVSFYQAFTKAVLLLLYQSQTIAACWILFLYSKPFQKWLGSGGDRMTVGTNCVWLYASPYWHIFCAVSVYIKPICVHTMWIYNTLLLKILDRMFENELLTRLLFISNCTGIYVYWILFQFCIHLLYL